MIRTELLSIGAELLLGETVDTNAAFLGVVCWSAIACSAAAWRRGSSDV